MSVIGSNIIAGASGTIETGYQIARSLRFNSADSAYLNRTPASAGNRNRWTVAFWIKPTLQNISNVPTILGVDTSATDAIQFEADYTMNIVAGGVSVLRTSRVFRDPASFMHVVISADTTNATAANKLKVSINGSLETAFSTDTRSSLTTNSFKINNALIHHIGNNPAVARYLGAYLADFYFIDGQALDPTSFGEFDANTGVWVPKAYTGTYGTNGFWLKFDDNSGVTATTLGKDSSGNGNNWTPNNFSVTAGVGNDSLVDSPTNYGTDTGAGGEVRGNYCTWNPLVPSLVAGISNGSLDAVVAAGSVTGTNVISGFGVSAGKWYFEGTVFISGTTAAGSPYIGVAIDPSSATSQTGALGYVSNGQKFTSATGSAYGATFANGDVIGVALDLDAGTIAFYKNGVSQGTAFTGLSGTYYPYARLVRDTSYSSGFYLNAGQRPFAYTAPSGFKALCTTNLPTPAIAKADTAFDVELWTGNGSARSITGVPFSPDLVWVKGRSGVTDHALYDRVRGVQLDLVSNSTAAETTQAQGITAFNSDGFSIGTLAKLNTNAATYVGWSWKAGGTGVSNTAGSVTSTVSANTTAGISVVSFAIPASGNITVGHGLGVTPAMIIAKGRGSADNWVVWHKSATTTTAQYLRLNTTDVVQSSAGAWGAAVPNSTVFGVLSGTLLAASQNAIAYCFAEVAGFSKFGSYVGNGSADGPFVYCGFRPRWIMYKASSGTSDWVVIDTTRDDFNVADSYLLPNSSAAEATSAIYDVLSNGFKCRSATFANTSAVTYIFAAFAEAPFNYARAR